LQDEPDENGRRQRQFVRSLLDFQISVSALIRTCLVRPPNAHSDHAGHFAQPAAKWLCQKI